MSGRGKRLNPEQPSAIPIATRLTWEQYEGVKQQAKRQNTTASALIRGVLNEYLHKAKTTA